MKTGELFVEQVLIGALVLAIGIGPWIPDLYTHLDQVSTVMGLAGGAIVIGLCFLLGIIFDRLADSLMDHLERHHRLHFAFGKLRKSHNSDRHAQESQDPFPEDRLRLAMLRDSDGILDWMDYHRSRIRLSRALAVYLPGLTLAIVVGLLRFFEPKTDERFTLWWLLIIPASYLFAALLSWIRSAPPRTDDRARFETYGEMHGLQNPSCPHDRVNKYLVRVFAFALDPSAGSAFPLLPAVYLAARHQNLYLIAAATGGIFLSGLSLWSWWRISHTYREYLYQVGTFPGNDNKSLVRDHNLRQKEGQWNSTDGTHY